jgi:hypothetical protein
VKAFYGVAALAVVVEAMLRNFLLKEIEIGGAWKPLGQAVSAEGDIQGRAFFRHNRS